MARMLHWETQSLTSEHFSMAKFVAMTFGQLSELYFPRVTSSAARRKLRDWIRSNHSLQSALRGLGWKEGVQEVDSKDGDADNAASRRTLDASWRNREEEAAVPLLLCMWKRRTILQK